MEKEFVERSRAIVDRLVAEKPAAVRSCNSCRWCLPVDENYLSCQVEYVTPANIMAQPPLPLESPARWMTRLDVERWESKRQKSCLLWAEKQ